MKKYKGQDWGELVKPLLHRPYEQCDDDKNLVDLAALLDEASHRCGLNTDEWAARIARHVRSFLTGLAKGGAYDCGIWGAIAACEDDFTMLQWTADNIRRAWW